MNQNKWDFQARYGDAEHVRTTIRMAPSSNEVTAAMRNPVFSREHHELMLNHELDWVRGHAIYSRHITTEDLTKIIRTPGTRSGTLNAAMQHKLVDPEDIKHIAMHHPNRIVKEGAVKIYHSKKGWTPEELHQVAAGNPSPNISMAIWNSTLPKDHPPLTHKDVHNTIVRYQGGTLR